jgi:hypothetical protein
MSAPHWRRVVEGATAVEQVVSLEGLASFGASPTACAFKEGPLRLGLVSESHERHRAPAGCARPSVTCVEVLHDLCVGHVGDVFPDGH